MARKRITGTGADSAGDLPIDADDGRTLAPRRVESLEGRDLTDTAIPAFVESFKAQAQHMGSPDSDEGVDTAASGDVDGKGEQLDERLRACLEQMRQDFERGIVIIDEEGTSETYARALKTDKTAGQKWETLKARFLANGAELLKKAAAMPEGACLIGVYSDGTLAIRQRSREIVNVVRKDIKGEFVLLPHAEAMALPKSRIFAKATEIVKAVEDAGYHVPADPVYRDKKGLVAASEVVMGGNYVESPVTADPSAREWRSAMVKCDPHVLDGTFVRVVDFEPIDSETYVYDDVAHARNCLRGAVLWLRG